jgi:hypothetical protein
MNERDILLRQAGFSEAFIEAMHEFEKSIPDIDFDSTFEAVEDRVEVVDATNQAIISTANNNYANNVILVRN